MGSEIGNAVIDLPRMFVELFKRFGPNFRPEDVYAATLFGRMAALDAGVTTLLDWAHIQNSPEHADAAIRAYGENVTDPSEVGPALQRGLKSVREGKSAVISVWLPRLLQAD